MMATQWDAMRDRLLAEYGAINLPEVTTTDMIAEEDTPARRARSTANLRQIRATSEIVKPSRSWWEECGPDGFTKIAEARVEKMKTTKEYTQVSGSLGV